MDVYNQQNNYKAIKKRKLSQSNEREGNVKRQNIQNEKSPGCFGRCYTKKKEKIITLKSSKEKKLIKNENINQKIKPILPLKSVPKEKVSNAPMTYLQRSPVYNEYPFCQKSLESSYDPCIECNVQYGPDTWENIPKNFQSLNKSIFDNNECMTIERFDTFLDKAISNDDFDSIVVREKVCSLKTNVNSFINEIIGDGVDRMSELISTILAHRNEQKDFKMNGKLSANSGNRKSNENQFNSDFIKQQQQYSGLVFEKQNLKKTSRISHHSSIQLSLDNKSSSSSQVMSDRYNWNLETGETNVNEQKAIDGRNPSQDQESYKWDHHEYAWPSSRGLSQQGRLVDNSTNDPPKQTVTPDKDIFLSDDDSADLSYSVASVLPSNRRKRSQLDANDLKHSSSSQHSENVISYNPDMSEHNEERIHLNEYEVQSHTNSNTSEQKTLLQTFNSFKQISSKSNHDASHLINSSELDENIGVTISSVHGNRFLSEDIDNPTEQKPIFNGIKSRSSSEIDHPRERFEQSDRFSATSVSNLFKPITQAKKQKSLDLGSISTAYSIPISVRPSVLPEIVTDKHDKNDSETPRAASIEKRLAVSSDVKTNQQSSIISIDEKNQTNINLPIERTRSGLTDKLERQIFSLETNRNPLRTGNNDTFNQARSTYDDIMNSWRRLLERLLSFMLPPIHNTDNDITLSSSSIFTSNTHSWSTIIPTETVNMNQSDIIGPWWGRRDAYDSTPATFIFANESLRTWCSIETITRNKQMCISVENRPLSTEYYSCPHTCCYYCDSSITINNSSSSS